MTELNCIRSERLRLTSCQTKQVQMGYDGSDRHKHKQPEPGNTSYLIGLRQCPLIYHSKKRNVKQIQQMPNQSAPHDALQNAVASFELVPGGLASFMSFRRSFFGTQRLKTHLFHSFSLHINIINKNVILLLLARGSAG